MSDAILLLYLSYGPQALCRELRRSAMAPSGGVSFGALFPPDKAWMIGRTPEEIGAVSTTRKQNIAPLLDELRRMFVGRHGVVSVGDGLSERGQTIYVFTIGDPAAAQRAMPSSWRGFPLAFRGGIRALSSV